MRLLIPALCATGAAALLAGCSTSNLWAPNASAPATQANHLVNGRFVPSWSKFANLIPAELQPSPQRVLDRIASDGHKNGAVDVYGSQYFATIINGYAGGDPKDGPPVCTLHGSYVSDVAVDGKGDVIDPDSGSVSIILYRPKCGTSLGTISDGYGSPSDAASFDVLNKKIVVANAFGSVYSGGIAVCTLANGCTTFLTNENMFEVAGVALGRDGDCWASASDSYGTATMTYFNHCSGSGQTATGWKNTYYGGLDIDAQGHIVAVDAFVPQLWVYRGCKPACKVVAGPFPLHGDTVFGHLNRTGTQWIGGDFQNGMLDVYDYSTKGLTYEYSIDNGFTVSDDVEGAAFSPASKE
jgi:hypothetical protein